MQQQNAIFKGQVTLQHRGASPAWAWRLPAILTSLGHLAAWGGCPGLTAGGHPGLTAWESDQRPLVKQEIGSIIDESRQPEKNQFTYHHSKSSWNNYQGDRTRNNQETTSAAVQIIGTHSCLQGIAHRIESIRVFEFEFDSIRIMPGHFFV
ncbi:hypothetical protein PSTG_15748 [Puccinia striiformis f. sp. tritici PST-78]|uniref:Uncharacterized protein n=1 Tax=Puccinia striiformis f. sp. tritici PST-78 TaxID=1165861 RepID=A0A0L0UVQ8_9BASI|nr:hypothetical protein PSTG_15748 [Puccinia striiformis f. sp. tritici PST-78]